MRRLNLTWGDYAGKPCLWIHGWSPVDLRELTELGPSDLNQRIAVLPADLVQDGRGFDGLQSVAGGFVLDREAVGFIPRFPFVDGLGYAVLFDGGSSHSEILRILRPQRAEPPTTTVSAIYPTTAAVPVNLLKLYVYFSAPMSEGWAARAIQMIQAETGEELQDTFVLMEPELWDWDRQRLTILLDPGRIKRGLVPNAEAGYPLVEGNDVVIRVDAMFQDAAGRPLIDAFVRRYQVGPALRTRIEPRDWLVSPPAAGTRERLEVLFDRPLDHALLQRCLSVADAAGRRVPGQILTGIEERSIRFEPDAAWKNGRYFLTIDPLLEDLAGNSVARVFDRDLTRPDDDPGDGSTVALEFTC
jgi:hypothetical protein